MERHTPRNEKRIPVRELSESEFISQFKERMLRHRLWSHPYIAKMRTGGLSLDQVRECIIQRGKIDEAYFRTVDRAAAALGHQVQSPSREADNAGFFPEIFTLCGVSVSRYLATRPHLGGERIIRKISRADACQSGGAYLIAHEDIIRSLTMPILIEALTPHIDARLVQHFDEHMRPQEEENTLRLIQAIYQQASEEERTLGEVYAYQDESLQAHWGFYNNMLAK